MPPPNHLEEGEVREPEEGDDLVVPGELRLLQDEPEEDAGQEPEVKACDARDLQWSHHSTLRKTSRAVRMPESIMAARKIQLLTASCRLPLSP